MHADTPDSPSSPPGLRRVVLSAVFHAQADQIPHLAQAIAFNGFLAIPSALLLAVGVFSATVGQGSMQTLLDHLNGVVPDSVLELVRASMTQLLASDRSDVMIAVGAVFALWSLSGAMQTVMWSLNAAHELTETRGFVRKRIVALLMILVALLAVGLVVFMLVLGPTISSWLQDQTGVTAVSWLWDYGRWPLLVLGLLFVFAGVLFLGPGPRSPRVPPDHAGSGAGGYRVDDRLGRARDLRRPLRWLQQGLGVAGGRDRDHDLAVAVEPGAAGGSRAGRRAAARPRGGGS